MPILTESVGRLTSTSLLTVAAKRDRGTPTVEVPAKGRATIDVPYLVELFDQKSRPIYVVPLTPQVKALSVYVVSGDWIAPSAAAAASLRGGVG